MATIKTIIEPTGTTTAAYRNSRHQRPQAAIIVAGNSGRPAGGNGAIDEDGNPIVKSVHANHRTQEEDIVSNWLITTAGDDVDKQTELFARGLFGRWGLKEPKGESCETIQGKNYTSPDIRPSDYADCWTLPGDIPIKLSEKVKTEDGYRYDTSHAFACELLFISGPNANEKSLERDPTSSVRRTFCARAAEDYEFFCEAIKAALGAAVDKALELGIKTVYLARISCGIYAGKHRDRINKDYIRLANEMLDERDRRQRLRFVYDVVLS